MRMFITTTSFKRGLDLVVKITSSYVTLFSKFSTWVSRKLVKFPGLQRNTSTMMATQCTMLLYSKRAK